MIASVFLLLAALFVQGAHSYLLFSQRSERKWSISDHAVLTPFTRLVYFLGHFLGGGAWLVAAYKLFIPLDLHFIFYVSAVTVALEWAQAATPSVPGRIVTPHSILAYAMWVGCMISIILGSFYVPQEVWQHVLSGLAVFAIVAMFVWMHLHKERIYRLQYATIYCFFAGMFVLSL